MSRLLAILALLAALAPQPVEDARPYRVALPMLAAPAWGLRLVWVEGDGAPLTAGQRAEGRRQLAAALAYWRDGAGVALPETWEEATAAYPAPWDDWRWLLLLRTPGALTVAIVANPDGQPVQLGGWVGAYGYNLPGGDALFCTARGDLLEYPHGLGMCLAHEIGHWLGLPEGGDERAGPPYSIMYQIPEAWVRRELHPRDAAAAKLPPTPTLTARSAAQ